jgi:hypothetical protein
VERILDSIYQSKIFDTELSVCRQNSFLGCTSCAFRDFCENDILKSLMQIDHGECYGRARKDRTPVVFKFVKNYKGSDDLQEIKTFINNILGLWITSTWSFKKSLAEKIFMYWYSSDENKRTEIINELQELNYLIKNTGDEGLCRALVVGWINDMCEDYKN